MLQVPVKEKNRTFMITLHYKEFYSTFDNMLKVEIVNSTTGVFI